MLKIGDKVKYRDLVGDIVMVMDDMAIVKLPDGKDYSLPYDMLTLDGAAVQAPIDTTGIMRALKPFLKNINFLNDLAKVMSESGVNELHIKAGSIQTFTAKESLEEKIAKYKAEALAEAERKAREEYEREGN
jgi:hypothetical protein